MKKTRLLLVLSLAAALTAACGQGNKDVGEGVAEQATNVNDGLGSAETVVKPVEKTVLNVRYYVSDDELSELMEYKTDVTFAKNEDKYLAALKALQLEKEDGAVSLWKNAEFLTAVLKDGKLTVDVSIPEDAHLGAPGEQLALDAIQQVAFQFKEVMELDLLVDGKAVDSLMGHVELEHPIARPA